MLVLEDKLLDNIIAYDLNLECNKILISQIFKHFQPCITSEWQLEKLGFLDDDILEQLENTPLINRIEENLNSFDELVKSSHLKLILVTSIDKTKNFKQVDITENKIRNIFSQTYTKKDKIREDIKLHIKDLLSDKKNITIKDKYLFKEWAKNSKVLDEILPQNGNLNIFVHFNETNDFQFKLAKQELQKMRKSMKTEIKEYQSKVLHDRYIIAENLEIILSSVLGT